MGCWLLGVEGCVCQSTKYIYCSHQSHCCCRKCCGKFLCCCRCCLAFWQSWKCSLTVNFALLYGWQKGKGSPAPWYFYLCVCVCECVGGWDIAVCVCVNGRPVHNKQISSHGNAYEQRTNKQATRPATTATQHQHQQRQQPQWYNFISELWKKVSSGVGSSSSWKGGKKQRVHRKKFPVFTSQKKASVSQICCI